jgi:hypothetical protein
LKLVEASMSAAVSAWLRAEGLRVYAEVPWHFTSIDHAGVSESRIVLVEMKRCLSEGVMQQACTHQLVTDEVYCVVLSRPAASSVSRAREIGLGVARVYEDRVCIMLPPKPRKGKSLIMRHYVERFRARVAKLDEGGVGGKPTLKGEGPAQDVYRAVRRYRREHPGVTWKELYQAVPNHYAHARSMQLSMGKLEQWGRVPPEDPEEGVPGERSSPAAAQPQGADTRTR